MPDFTYSGEDDRYYPSLALTVHPGDRVTLDADPGDGRFSPAGAGAFIPPPVVDTPDPTPADSPEVGN